ncbi:hypothetical protein [Agromyces humi]|uniref:hypothetical protein n=1 Tax=Agromyces humi TaxID=1766800 RepID=UPI00135C0C36|nr:hypothetical protein [Agromyces humi]
MAVLQAPTGEVGHANELTALPDGSVVVLWADEEWFADTDIYSNFAGRWRLQNPEDPDLDGRTYDATDLWVVATVRDHRNIAVVWNPDQPSPQITDPAELDALPGDAIVVEVDKDGYPTPHRKMGGWVNMDSDLGDPGLRPVTPADLLCWAAETGSTVHHGWQWEPAA